MRAMAMSEFIGLLFLAVSAASVFEARISGVNETSITDTQNVHIPISKESDFGEGMNRDWMEGYYSPRKSYFRVYMSVYDEINYPKFKDIWLDKSGHVVISGRGVLWIGFGRPARQIKFAEKYLKQGRKKHETNKPLIRSFLLEAGIATMISSKSVEERFNSQGVDMNVDVNESPNQFGLDTVSTELLRQNALSHSLVTYYLEKPNQSPPSWGLVEQVGELNSSVKKMDLDRLIPNKNGGIWITEKLFPIKDDILFQNRKFDIAAAERDTAVYRGFLVKREVLLALIDEVEIFYEKGGKPYNTLKGSFLQYVKKNKRIIDSFKLGEDVTKQALDAIENSLISDMNKAKPSGCADKNLWERFKFSVNQVKNYVTYSGTEIRLGNPKKIIAGRDVFKNYQTFAAPDSNHVLPKLQLARESTNIGIRMTYDKDLPASDLCNFIKHNFMGRRLANLQLIARLNDAIDLITYAKQVADCLVQDKLNYIGKPFEPTLVTIYGQDDNEYRFYPDAQVVGSKYQKGTALLFAKGSAVNLRIRGAVRSEKDVLLGDKIKQDNPKLWKKIEDARRNNGLVIIPQRYIKWPKKGEDLGASLERALYRLFNATYSY